MIDFQLPLVKNQNKHKTRPFDEKQNTYWDKNTRLKWVEIKPDLFTLEVDFEDTIKTVNVKKTDKKKSVVVEFPEKSEVIQINLDPIYKLIDETSPSKKLESISELAGTEVKLDITKLPEYYMKLSKVRLTGK